MEFILNDFHRNISDEELLEDVKRVAVDINRGTLSALEYKQFGKYGVTTLCRHFGSWSNVLARCNIPLNAYQIGASQSSHTHRKVATEEFLSDIRKVAEQLGVKTISSGEYEKYGKYSRDLSFRRFSSWNEALEAAGLEPFKFVSGKRIDDETLLIEIERMWIALGRQPTTTDIKNGFFQFTLNTYIRHFGGWRGTLEAFIEWVNSDNSEYADRSRQTTNDVKQKRQTKPSKQYSKDDTKPRHTTSRNINYRLMFQVMKRDNFKCWYCGRSTATDPTVVLQVDHIIPWSKGGETTMENLRTSCSKCNLGKSDLLIE